MTLRNIPRKQYIDPLPPTAQFVYRCRVCGWTNYGWCLLADPRIVVGLCLECKAKEAQP